ncbi:hypothetical protein F5879DRAFT_984826 [Lentinula edodes]|nr:hypothetical protein F5879DRAFT_984826 [Lentinula edodes]KAJ3920915.1 hypothetical protein F5877DRAFT_76682 [Lentinula edodes]
MSQEMAFTTTSEIDSNISQSTHSTSHLTRRVYTTNVSKEGYISVLQYRLNGYMLMMDEDDGYILWSSLWKAVGNCSIDVKELLRLRPDLARSARIIKDGESQIRGTWLPYQLVSALAIRIAWPIRNQLTPFFGYGRLHVTIQQTLASYQLTIFSPEFSSKCIPPDHTGQKYDLSFVNITPSNYLRRTLSVDGTQNTNAASNFAEESSTHSLAIPYPSSHRSSSLHPVPLGSVLGGDPYPISIDPRLNQTEVFLPSVANSYNDDKICQSYSRWPPQWDSTFFSASSFSSPEHLLAASIPNLEIDMFGSAKSVSKETFVPVLPPISILEDLREFHVDDGLNILHRLTRDDHEIVLNDTDK